MRKVGSPAVMDRGSFGLGAEKWDLCGLERATFLLRQQSCISKQGGSPGLFLSLEGLSLSTKWSTKGCLQQESVL